MKTILLASLLLLGCWGSAEAVSIVADIEDQAYVKMSRAELEQLARAVAAIPNATLRVDLVDNVCLQRMEAAMRTMEPFIARRTYEVDLCTKRNSCTSDQGDKFEPAKSLWDTTKRDCWAKP